MEKDKNTKVWYASKSLKWGERNGENRSVWHLNAVTPIMCIFKLFSQKETHKTENTPWNEQNEICSS